MLNILVTVDRSLEASFALRTACLFGTDLNVQPIYVFERPGRDIAFGAGWARKSWERETSRMAEEDIGDLVVSERSQCQNIHDPVVLTGDPYQEPAKYFWSGKFDLLLVGAPFRGLSPLALCKRFGHVSHKEQRSLPLMVVQKFKNIENIVAFTDGSDSAENTLGLLLKINSFLSGRIVLIGLESEESDDSSTENLNLERGLAIMNEKEMQAEGHTASALGADRLSEFLKTADLLVNPIHRNDPSHLLYELQEDDIQAVLLYLDSS